MRKLTGQLKQAGISLLEVLLSLAIISIILVMAMQYFTTAGNSQKLNMVRNFVGADMAAIQAYGINNSSDYSALTSWQPLIDGGYLTNDTKSLNCTGGSCTQVTPWGQNVTIDVANNNPSLTVPLPTESLCQNLLQSYGAQFVTCDGSGTATVYINGGHTA